MNHNIYSDRKIFGFPEKIASFRSGEITAPIYVRIKPINRCSHACSWCVYSDGHTRPKDRPEEHLQAGMHGAMKEQDVMDTDKLLYLLEDLKAIGTQAVTFSGGGEPLMHPAIVQAFDFCRHLSLKFSIITNGQSLTGDRAKQLAFADWVRVSMDYATPGQMARSRNVPERAFGQVIANLQEFARIKQPTCDLGVNFIVTRENHRDLFLAAGGLKECGVENVRFSPVYCKGFLEYHAPLQDEVIRQLNYIQDSLVDAKFSVNTTYDLSSPSKRDHHPFTRCFYAQTVPVVGADLGIYACHNTAYTAHGFLGHIIDAPFREVWFSDVVAKRLRELNPCKVCNHECANHSKVALFEELATARFDPFV